MGPMPDAPGGYEDGTGSVGSTDDFNLPERALRGNPSQA